MAEEKPEIEQLLSCRLDNELSERQDNEFRRLLQHNRALGEDYRRLERQKQLLNALPTASAPPELVNNVKASVERRSILGEYPTFGGEHRAVRQSHMRRLIAAAAMLFLPLGLLALVIYSILAPLRIDSTSGTPVADVDTTGGISAPQPTASSADEGAFTALIELATVQAIGVNSFIAKAVYSNDLLDNTVPVRRAAQNSFYISCRRSRMEKLLVEITSLWQRCGSVRLTLYGTAPQANIVIENISAEQVLELFGTDSAGKRKTLAAHIGRYNAIISSLPAYEILAARTVDDTATQTPLSPVKPIFASGDAGNTGIATADTDTGEEISLIITVSTL